RMIIVLDMIVLMELTACIGISSHFSDTMTGVFLITYIPVVLATVFFGKRYLRKKFPTASFEEEDRIAPIFPSLLNVEQRNIKQ
ncbi:MAG: hypothetical protein ACOZBW_07310, partial [Thermodesulfobacteriota bacterium]